MKRGILEGERTTDGLSLTTVNGAATFLLAESFLNNGLHRKVVITRNKVLVLMRNISIVNREYFESKIFHAINFRFK